MSCSSCFRVCRFRRCPVRILLNLREVVAPYRVDRVEVFLCSDCAGGLSEAVPGCMRLPLWFTDLDLGASDQSGKDSRPSSDLFFIVSAKTVDRFEFVARVLGYVHMFTPGEAIRA